MFLMFNKGQCHFCGDFGKKLDEGVFHCKKCNTVFNEFGFSPYAEPKEIEDRFWQ